MREGGGDVTLPHSDGREGERSGWKCGRGGKKEGEVTLPSLLAHHSSLLTPLSSHLEGEGREGGKGKEVMIPSLLTRHTTLFTPHSSEGMEV